MAIKFDIKLEDGMYKGYKYIGTNEDGVFKPETVSKSVAGLYLTVFMGIMYRNGIRRENDSDISEIHVVEDGFLKKYFLGNKLLLIVKNNFSITGEINLTEKEAEMIVKKVSEIVPRKEQDIKPKPYKNETASISKESTVSKTTKTEPVKKTASLKGSALNGLAPRKRARNVENPFKEETKTILSNISKKDMDSKGFSFMTEEDYKKHFK